MEFVNCIICNSKDNFKLIESVCDRFKKQDSYNILECSCGMVMLNPRPNISNIAEHYESNDYQPHYKKNNLLNLLYRIAQFINNNSKASVIGKYFKKGSLLDFGGGDGQFNSYMARNKWNSIYYEPHLEKKDSHHIVDITELNKESFDVITMFHSVEHLHNIHESLSNIYNLLDPQGVLLISFPNYYAYEKSFFKEHWIAYDAPRHLYHFSPKSIEKLLIKKKFRIIESKAVYLDTFYNIIMSTNKIYKYLFFVPFQIIVSIYNIFMNKGVGSSILLVCKKQ